MSGAEDKVSRLRVVCRSFVIKQGRKDIRPQVSVRENHLVWTVESQDESAASVEYEVRPEDYR
jgi:hypothetical protein